MTLTFDPPPSPPLNVTGKSRTILALVPAFYESLILSLALGVCVYAVSGHSSYCPKERSLLQFHFRPFATVHSSKLVYKINVKALTPLPPNVIMTLIFPKIVWKRPLTKCLLKFRASATAGCVSRLVTVVFNASSAARD